VSHACNSSYSGVRDQENHGSKPAQANSSQDAAWKIPNTNKGWQSGSNGSLPSKHETLDFKPQYHSPKINQLINNKIKGDIHAYSTTSES
jgi:hypothetical protein